ncbi:LOW QUALITY PROTEIN: dnaJ homolog subfamily C member 16-like [Xenia sp. Carnegie-2017]|uniref:LOW QUALITY PROTEIN: dnaJ homolog subfamily C member 16-like n=1 Tax=Xenia sp. Carnegie-2017 TaxID=2897299 RepID=UPI001F04BEDD|nr:LOW QUALITY PROTEIN: dnaJ homolog subfamily C member 16-like [Xenia sp. Carnegie-2017]
MAACVKFLRLNANCVEKCHLLILFVNFFLIRTSCKEDYYSILGIDRNANVEEIKRSYRRLAKEWHPDRTRRSGAEEKFIEINKAYEVLSDSNRRSEYDRFGETGTANYPEQKFHFFYGNEFMFFNGMPNNKRHEDLITTKFYQYSILPESRKKIYLLKIISNWCLSCSATEDIWEDLSRDLQRNGIGTGRVNKNFDPIAQLLDVRRLPDFVAVIYGRLYHFTGIVSVENLKKFVSDLISSYHYIHELTDGNFEDFLSHWYDNKPRVVLLTTKKEPPLLLKTVVFKYRHYIGVGYAQTTKNPKLINNFSVSKTTPSLMIFKENVRFPHIFLKGSDLKAGALELAIFNNLYLNLPRLSSQMIFQSFALINLTPEHFNEREVKKCLYKQSRSKKIAILRRVKENEIRYTWFENGWCGVEDVKRLSHFLKKVQRGEIDLELKAVLPNLNDEHKKDIGGRILDLWRDIHYYSIHYINWSSHLPKISLVMTALMVIFISVIFPFLSEKEDKKKDSLKTEDVFGLIELNSVTQNQVIQQCPSGHLVVILLSDAMSGYEAFYSPIVKTFANIIQPFRRESIFKMGWLSIPRYIAWCNEVMNVQTFGKITPGTVLVLNPKKKYLSIFKINKITPSDPGSVFDDFEEEEMSSCQNKTIFSEDKRTQKRTAYELGQQFPRWMEKLLQGMIARVKLENWPHLESDECFS